MKRLARKLTMRTLGYFQQFPTQLTPRQELCDLLQRLRPRVIPTGFLRLGPAGDGGYLVPDDLAGITACFSPGVSDCSGFEQDCADRGLEVFLADYSVSKPAAAHPRFHFTQKYVGAYASEEFMTLDHWVANSLPNSQDDLLLQIDIEGFEYETLLNVSETLLRRFRIIVCEFHNLEQLWNRPFFRLAARAFGKLLESHACVHLHPNNYGGCLVKDGLALPAFMEFTFLRRDRLGDAGFATTFPHPLDHENAPQGRPLPLPACWFKDVVS